MNAILTFDIMYKSVLALRIMFPITCCNVTPRYVVSILCDTTNRPRFLLHRLCGNIRASNSERIFLLRYSEGSFLMSCTRLSRNLNCKPQKKHIGIEYINSFWVSTSQEKLQVTFFFIRCVWCRSGKSLRKIEGGITHWKSRQWLLWFLINLQTSLDVIFVTPPKFCLMTSWPYHHKYIFSSLLRNKVIIWITLSCPFRTLFSDWTS